jgi:NAD(P)-dependent dehydrogenase (short-subunit alcohol dehydrogenase family)
MELERGQVAVVTGGGSGIGRALCEAFAAQGMNLVIADIDQTALGRAVEQIQRQGVSAIGRVVDVSDGQAVHALADGTLEEFGRIDVIVNNAGTVGKCLPVWEFEDVEWEWILGVDLWGVIHGVHAFVPHLVAQGHGYVVNTASVAGLETIALLAPYAAAKHAVVSLSETLWTDLQDRAPGVGVTVLCPGPTYTRLMTEGGRSRPEHLRPKVDAGIAPQKNPATFSASSTAMCQPEQVAEATIEAMRRNQLYLAPNPGSIDRIDRRLSRLRADVLALQVDPENQFNSYVAFQGEKQP